jgi:hypothetical protein
MKRALAFLLVLCLAPVANAGPRQVLGKIARALDKSHITFDLAVGASSGTATIAGYDCRRRNGPEPCTAHYGSIAGSEIARGILTGGLIAWSEYGRKQGFRDWFVPALAVGIGNTYWTVHEERIYVPKTDLSSSTAAFRRK